MRVPRVKLSASKLLAVKDELKDILLSGRKKTMKAERADSDGKSHGLVAYSLNDVQGVQKNRNSSDYCRFFSSWTISSGIAGGTTEIVLG